ncbi:universal stress protein [Agromyces sp. S2-1-8]|uniref:universal stress protein n=1 Tax=Agromyces sp. S2-1-8 TaxID=2897180 RepID=UPI001E549570|nr:universal stress protein [Agromyces sp. S2-1-8]MCD5348247.1 universal stress protein [Agromyces sp. S2-1-8]
MQEQRSSDRILVGVDGSASSVEALRYAARIADAFGAPLEVLTTWTFPPIAGAYVIDGWSPEEDARSAQDAAIEEAFDGEPPAGLRRAVLAGPAARTLIEESRRAGMLVLGSRGHGGFAGLLLGSVSATCAEHARCPVLVVRSGGDRPEGA